MVLEVSPSSLLPLVEPLLAAVFGINVAYINLERFRYRRIVRKQSRELIDSLRVNSHFPTIEESDSVLTLYAYASLRDNDPLGESDSDHAKFQVKDIDQKTITEKVGKRYRICFSNYQDTLICEFMCYFSGILLFLSVNHSLGFGFLANLFSTPESMTYWAWFFMLGLVLPLVFIRLGNSVVGGMRDRANKAHKDLERILQKFAESQLDKSLSAD